MSLGIGVGLIAEIAFDAARDPGLVRIDLGAMFPSNVARVATRAGVAMRQFERRFLEIVLQADGPCG